MGKEPTNVKDPKQVAKLLARGIELRAELDRIEFAIEEAMGAEVSDFGEVWNNGSEGGLAEAAREITEQTGVGNDALLPQPKNPGSAKAKS